MKKFKIFTALFLLAAIGLTFVQPALAVNSKTYGPYKDVGTNHWAYDAVTYMTGKKIISGYSDGTFRPNNKVTRAEFAKMMVLALDLKLHNPKDKSFLDIGKDNWAFKYIESAKYYLTGFRSSNGDYFKPSQAAVREDMAVALVKAMKHDEIEGSGILGTYRDGQLVSKNLRGFVNAAIKKGIMKGYKLDGGKMEFRPQNDLTRAETAVLLYRCLKEEEEKVTYDEDKITYDDEDEDECDDDEDECEQDYSKPVVKVETSDGKLIVEWSKTGHSKFAYYKVVASKTDNSPKYPEDGYFVCIGNRNSTKAVVKNGDKYNGGDFGGVFKSGEKYYISVTTVYKDKKVPGNSVLVKMP